jgi:UDP-glucose 4-epimerase
MRRKILVTGSSGFVGTNFIRMSPEYDIFEVDLIKKKVTEVDFKGVVAVLHLAALVHQRKGASDEEYIKINCDLAFEMAKKSKSEGVKHFILMSTAKVYGESTLPGESWNEYSPCNPADAYGRSKLAAEKKVQRLGDEDFKITIIRSPLVYGSGVKANMFNLIKLTDRFPILPFGGINNKRSMVYIGNLVALLKKTIDKQAVGIFIAGNLYPISTTQLVQQISTSLAKKSILITLPVFLLKFLKFLFPALINRLTGSLLIDSTGTNNVLEFIPPFSFEHGIDEMVTWYKQIKMGH